MLKRIVVVRTTSSGSLRSLGAINLALPPVDRRPDSPILHLLVFAMQPDGQVRRAEVADEYIASARQMEARLRARDKR